MIAERPDLTKPRGLSKSELTAFEWCMTEAWFRLHDPRPWVPAEPMTFGSAVDRGAELYIVAARAGLTTDDVADLHQRAMDAALEKAAEDDIELDEIELRNALRDFNRDIIPAYTWTHALTQHHITGVLDELGPVDGHPDIILGIPELDTEDIYDIKTGSPKQTARTLELGFYVLIREMETGKPVRQVGYIYWNRKLVRPKWGVVTEPVTDELRRWAYEGAASYVRAKKADAMWNAKAEVPVNVSFPGGPAWAGKCATCVYAPVNGGPCARAFTEENVNDAA